MTTTFGGHVLPSEDGFRTGMLIGCGAAIVAALVATTIPGRSRRQAAQGTHAGSPVKSVV
jgi:hypothetical protein